MPLLTLLSRVVAADVVVVDVDAVVAVDDVVVDAVVDVVVNGCCC